MKKTILNIFTAIFILIIGFSGGFFIGKKISNINKQNIEIVKIKSTDIVTPEKIEIPIIPEIIPVLKKVLTKEEIREQTESTYPVCPKPEKIYDDMFSLVIGKDFGLPDETYIPSNLREIYNSLSTKSGICLTKEARDNFESMLEKAHLDGYNIKASSGFRTYDYQNILFINEANAENQNIDIAIAKPGHSEHQLGVTVDVTGQSIKYEGASKRFDGSKESIWMKDYASDYGFIESYPSGKEKVTGYIYEPWHYRYVGVEKAKEIIKNGETINEYLSK